MPLPEKKCLARLARVPNQQQHARHDCPAGRTYRQGKIVPSELSRKRATIEHGYFLRILRQEIVIARGIVILDDCRGRVSFVMPAGSTSQWSPRVGNLQGDYGGEHISTAFGPRPSGTQPWAIICARTVRSVV